MKCVAVLQPGKPHPQSWRRRNVKNGYLLFGCPKGKWRVRRKVCSAKMRLWEKVKMASACRKGYRRA
jgi:hypothetical protein